MILSDAVHENVARTKDEDDVRKMAEKLTKSNKVFMLENYLGCGLTAIWMWFVCSIRLREVCLRLLHAIHAQVDVYIESRNEEREQELSRLKRIIAAAIDNTDKLGGYKEWAREASHWIEKCLLSTTFPLNFCRYSIRERKALVLAVHSAELLDDLAINEAIAPLKTAAEGLKGIE